ncbi:MAG: FecR family protein [Opitutaceae bacterium]
MTHRPENDSSLEREPTPTEQAALGWVVRCERGLDLEQETEFAGWLAANRRHRELFEEFGGTWAVMGRAREERCTVPTEPSMTAGARMPFEPAIAVGGPGTAGWRGVRMIWLPLAAAAAIAVAYIGWWRPAHYSTTILTEVGTSRQLKLPDGSTVELNTDSAIAAAFTPSERRVRLEKGEAHFKVAKNVDRPFVVEAAGVDVRAVGTAFNVRLRSESVEVLVTEGKVRVAHEPAPTPNVSVASMSTDKEAAPAAPQTSAGPRRATDAVAGERVVFSRVSSAPIAPAPIVTSVPSDEAQRILAWLGGHLDFSDTLLAEVVAEFNRYNQHKLAIADADLAALRFGGSFRPDDRVGFVRVLRQNFGVRAEEHENRTILHAVR